MNPHISISGLSKRFGNFAALENFSLDIYKGELFSILGPSGCGKTTLLKIIAGLQKADSGAVLIDGTELNQMPAHHCSVSMVFQNFALFPHMTVWQNVSFGLQQQKMQGVKIVERVKETLELVEMEQLALRRPHQLSQGQKQRTALARGLAPRPQILLLDEPLSALDRPLRKKTQKKILQIHRQLGMTVIMVTHDYEEALSMSSRIAVMKNGRIEQSGAPSEVCSAPNSHFVAEFVGID